MFLRVLIVGLSNDPVIDVSVCEVPQASKG